MNEENNTKDNQNLDVPVGSVDGDAKRHTPEQIEQAKKGFAKNYKKDIENT